MSLQIQDVQAVYRVIIVLVVSQFLSLLVKQRDENYVRINELEMIQIS